MTTTTEKLDALEARQREIQATGERERLRAILTKRGLTPAAARAVIGVLTTEDRLDATKDYLEDRLELGDLACFDAHRVGAEGAPPGGQEEPAPPPPAGPAPAGHGVLLAALGGPAPVVRVDPQAPGASAQQAARLVLAACGHGGEP